MKPSSKRFHISVSTTDYDASVADYSARLGTKPDAVIPGRYARWRTDLLNFSISCKPDQPGGIIRHIGFEDEAELVFREEQDRNGITWEYFTESAQTEEIEKIRVITKNNH
jgi:hypothetical protein